MKLISDDFQKCMSKAQGNPEATKFCKANHNWYLRLNESDPYSKLYYKYEKKID